MEDVMLVNARGRTIHAALDKRAPLVIFPKKNNPILSPAPIKRGIIKKVIKRVKLRDEEILLDTCFLSSLVNAVVKSGMRAIERDPTKVIGINNRGIVIPIAIPKSDIACELVYPTAISLAGIIRAIIGCTRLEIIRTQVIGVELLMTSLYILFGRFNLPPYTKYRITDKIAESAQAIVSESPALIAGVSDPIPKLNIKTHSVILTICSKSSVIQ